MTLVATRYCCARFASEVSGHRSFVAAGALYPAGMNPSGQIEQAEDDGSWNVNGCCGGGCYVLEGIKFCPFCGTKLAA